MNAPDKFQRHMGMLLDMPADAYHSIDALSSTGMRHLARSPWHYRNRVDVVPTKPMLCGTLAHCAVLEPDAMQSRYIVTPEGAPRRPTAAQWNAKKSSPESEAAKAWWLDFQRQADARQIVAHEDYAITQAQLRALRDEPYIAEILSSGHSEVSVFWIDPATGAYCKARPDHVHITSDGKARLLDLKSTMDESPSGFGRSAAKLGYHRQRAHYMRGFELATGIKVQEFVFAVVSSSPPVLAVPYWLPEDFEQQGVEECSELTALYVECQRTGVWPTYGNGPQLADIPRYAMRSSEIEVSYVD